tara:strand:+ start:2318 stop:2494 length:177 start_codon:yes stop_codon:yes gene_type:complete
MEKLFSNIAKDFSGKVFTKEDLMKKYQSDNERLLQEYYKNDIQKYIRAFKNKPKNQSL